MESLPSYFIFHPTNEIAMYPLQNDNCTKLRPFLLER